MNINRNKKQDRNKKCNVPMQRVNILLINACNLICICVRVCVWERERERMNQLRFSHTNRLHLSFILFDSIIDANWTKFAFRSIETKWKSSFNSLTVNKRNYWVLANLENCTEKANTWWRQTEETEVVSIVYKNLLIIKYLSDSRRNSIEKIANRSKCHKPRNFNDS